MSFFPFSKTKKEEDKQKPDGKKEKAAPLLLWVFGVGEQRQPARRRSTVRTRRGNGLGRTRMAGGGKGHFSGFPLSFQRTVRRGFSWYSHPLRLQQAGMTQAKTKARERRTPHSKSRFQMFFTSFSKRPRMRKIGMERKAIGPLVNTPSPIKPPGNEVMNPAPLLIFCNPDKRRKVTGEKTG